MVVNERFGRRSKVVVERDESPGIICDALGTETWKIEPVDPGNGKPTGNFANLKSQMMRNPKEGEFPMDSGDSSSDLNSGQEEEQKTGDIKVVLDAANRVTTHNLQMPTRVVPPHQRTWDFLPTTTTICQICLKRIQQLSKTQTRLPRKILHLSWTAMKPSIMNSMPQTLPRQEGWNRTATNTRQSGSNVRRKKML